MSESIVRRAAIVTVLIALGLGPILAMLNNLAPPGRGLAVSLLVDLGAGVTLALLYLFRKSISACRLRWIFLILVAGVAGLFPCLIGWYRFSELCIVYASRENGPPYEKPFIYFPLNLNGVPKEKVEHFGTRAKWAADNSPDSIRKRLSEMSGRTQAYAVTDAVLFLLAFATGSLVAFPIGLPTVYLAATSGAIRDVASRLGAEQGELERIVLTKIGFTNARRFAALLLERAQCVCRFESSGKMGTAFLVGPDLILTNNHVVEDLLADAGVAIEAVAKFDQDDLLLGTGNATGKEYRLADDWCVMHSEPLDYALVRLSAPAGQESVADAATPTQRGWVPLRANDVEAGESVFILQHPGGETMKLSVGSIVAKVTGTNEVTYTANSDVGSSGSPCFDMRLNLVALHFWGSKGDFNRGKLISAILEDLRGNNKLQTLPGR